MSAAKAPLKLNTLPYGLVSHAGLSLAGSHLKHHAQIDKLNGSFDRRKTAMSATVADAELFEIARCAPRVRLIRTLTHAGEIRVLATSSADWPACEFSDLYHLRWKIEELFKRLKSRCSLERPTGLTNHAAHLDHGARIVHDNLMSLASRAAEEECEEADPGHPYRYQINRSLAHTLSRSGFIPMIGVCLERFLQAASNLIDTLVKRRTHVRKGRTTERPKSWVKPHPSMVYS